MTKRSTNNMHRLDIRTIQGKGLLNPGASFTWQWTRDSTTVASIDINVDITNAVTLYYRTQRGGGEWQDKRYQVMVSWSACNYGGKRPWWLCPYCGRRVAVLWGDSTYACRHCQQINYESTRTTTSSKPFERANKLRRRLGWGGGIASPQGDKPRGMHWKTFTRHLDKLNQHGLETMASTDKLLERLTGRARKIEDRLGLG